MFSPWYPKAPLLANFQKVNVLIPNSTPLFSLHFTSSIGQLIWPHFQPIFWSFSFRETLKVASF